MSVIGVAVMAVRLVAISMTMGRYMSINGCALHSSNRCMVTVTVTMVTMVAMRSMTGVLNSVGNRCNNSKNFVHFYSFTRFQSISYLTWNSAVNNGKCNRSLLKKLLFIENLQF